MVTITLHLLPYYMQTYITHISFVVQKVNKNILTLHEEASLGIVYWIFNLSIMCCLLKGLKYE